MQIILTEDEYNKLCAKANNVLQVNEGIADYQRRFRVAFSNELITGYRHGRGISLDEMRSAIVRAEVVAKEIR